MRITCLSLTLFCLLSVSCSSRKDSHTAIPPSPADRYVESVNSVSGGFSVDAALSEDKKPFTISPTQAYARIVKNSAEPSKNDVLIVLVEKPLSRFALAVADTFDVEEGIRDLRAVLHNRNARGVAFRVPMGQQNADVDVRPFFNGNDYDFGNLIVQIKSSTADKIEGQITSDVSSQQADVNFSVKVQPDVWTGGAFYQQPPTNLSPGQASGELTVDDQTVKLNHAYARLVELDLFDETKNVFKVWLTEKPVDAKFLVDDNLKNLLGMKQSGNVVVFTYTTNGPADRTEPSVWLVGAVPDNTNDVQPRQLADLYDQIPGVERDYVRHNQEGLEGRVYSAFPIKEQDRVYKVDLLFNATILPPSVSDGPVTANNGGTALPADGGDPAKAYLAAMERMKSARDFDQKLAVWLSVVSTADAEKIKKDIDSLGPEQRQLLLEVFAPLEDLRLVSGFIKDNKATLRFSGTGREGKAGEVVNMHLENGQWKIGRREIREE